MGTARSVLLVHFTSLSQHAAEVAESSVCTVSSRRNCNPSSRRPCRVSPTPNPDAAKRLWMILFFFYNLAAFCQAFALRRAHTVTQHSRVEHFKPLRVERVSRGWSKTWCSSLTRAAIQPLNAPSPPSPFNPAPALNAL